MSLNDLTAPAKEAKSFDAWFFKQSKKSQDKMREAGVIPYREMVQSRHIFNIDPTIQPGQRWTRTTSGTRPRRLSPAITLA